MADDDIRIGLQVDGADKAVEELNKVREAESQVTEPKSKSVPAGGWGMDGQLNGTVPRDLQAEKEAAEKQVQALDFTRQQIDATRQLMDDEHARVTKKLADLDVLIAKERLAAREAEKAAAEGGLGGLLKKDITGGAQSALKGVASANGLGGEFGMLSKLISADAAVIGGSVLAIGAAAVKSYQMLSETTTGYRQFFADMRAQGQQVPAELESKVAGVEAALAPVEWYIEKVKSVYGGLWKTLKDPVGELSGLNAVKASFAEQLVQLEQLKKARHDAYLAESAAILAQFKEELRQLHEQEATIRRMHELRGAEENTAAAQAQANITIAKNNGEDTIPAQVDLMVAQMEGKANQALSSLDTARLRFDEAAQNYNKLYAQLQRAYNDPTVNKTPPTSKEFYNLSPDQQKSAQGFADLKAQVEAANVQFRDVSAELEKQKQLYELAKQTIESENAANLSNLQAQITDKSEASMTKVATDLKGKIEEISTAEGGKVSASLAAATKDITEILSNNKVTADEIPKLAKALQEFRQAQENKTQEMQGFTQQLLDAFNKVVIVTQSQKRQLDSLTEYVNSLPAQ